MAELVLSAETKRARARLEIMVEIEMQCKGQDGKWGEQNHHMLYWLGILMEEVGEVAKGMIEYDDDQMRKELIHTAAVAVAAIECFDRNWRGLKLAGTNK